jgi:nitronate monooxygenase
MHLHPTLQRLGIRKPIFQAPIGGVASPELAAAVSEAGGFGQLACTWRSVEQLDALFRRMASLTSRPYGVNFVLDFPIAEKLEVALAHKVAAVSFFWGDGSAYVDRVKAAGALAIQVAGSIAEAKRSAAAGFDLIVAQGIEAGGHVRGELGLMALGAAGRRCGGAGSGIGRGWYRRRTRRGCGASAGCEGGLGGNPMPGR